MLFEPGGAGGMASAYKAWHRDRGGRLFVVKVLRRDQRGLEHQTESLLAEGQIHQSIPPHPNLPDYAGHGCEDGECFYAAEYIPGERLAERLARVGRLPEREALAVCDGLLAALQHILQCGFLYRDVNARNVILHPKGRPVLLDFGLTEPLEVAGEGKQESYVDGTASFLPPERVLRQGEDEASVVYSLGLLLYFMLAGEEYVRSGTAAQTALRHIGVRLAVTPAHLPGCSESTVALVARMIRKDPAERFQTFEELRQAIAPILAGRKRNV